MNQDRSKIAEAALKNVETLKKSLVKTNSAKTKTPLSSGAATTAPTKLQASGLPEPVGGVGFVQIIMYILAGILLLGIFLLVVDYWFFPIFKRNPGGPGYVSLPGSDTSDNFWTNLREIRDITIGVPPKDLIDSNIPNPIIPLYTSALEGQSNYTITLDVLINDEKPQDLGPNASSQNVQRTFFLVGSLKYPIVTFTLENTTNTVHTNVFDKGGQVRSTIIDNVPIHKPFRLGFIKTPKVMEAYLNGLLVHTIQLQGEQINPTTGDTIFAPPNILRTIPESGTRSTTTYVPESNVILSRGIQVMNLRLFSNNITPSEMQARMSDLTYLDTFIPPKHETITASKAANTGKSSTESPWFWQPSFWS